jgi:hypothetical protein
MGVDEFLNGGLELPHTQTGAAAQLFVRLLGEPVANPSKKMERPQELWAAGDLSEQPVTEFT